MRPTVPPSVLRHIAHAAERLRWIEARGLHPRVRFHVDGRPLLETFTADGRRVHRMPLERWLSLVELPPPDAGDELRLRAA